MVTSTMELRKKVRGFFESEGFTVIDREDNLLSFGLEKDDVTKEKFLEIIRKGKKLGLSLMESHVSEPPNFCVWF